MFMIPKRRRLELVAAVTILVTLAVGIGWLLGRSTSPAKGFTPPVQREPAHAAVARHDPYQWPLSTSPNDWPVPVQTFATKQEILQSALAALFDPKGPRYLDLTRMACRQDGPYAWFKSGLEAQWNGTVGTGTTGIQVRFADFPFLVADVHQPEKVEWVTTPGAKGEESVLARVYWPTKPGTSQYSQVHVALGLFSESPRTGPWCFRSLAGGRVYGR